MIIKPIINLNGTAPQDLLDQHMNAIAALRSAISLLQAAAPNGRDYLTIKPDVFTTALNAHRDRLSRLESVIEELEHLVEVISDQC
jgi:hypothetical protein